MEALNSTRPCIYCITCKVNQKMYIGKTVQKISERWSQHFSSTKRLDTKFSRAIRKHGKENFELCILEMPQKETLSEREAFWIVKMDTMKKGYNSTLGGDGGIPGFKHSSKTRQKISKSRRGIVFSNEHKKNLSESHKGQVAWNKGLFGKNNPLHGRRRPEHVKNNISKSKYKKVEQLSTCGKLIRVHESLKAAAKEVCRSPQNISRVCRGQRNKVGGFKWRYHNDI